MEINITYKSPEHEAAFLSELQRIPHIVNPESGRAIDGQNEAAAVVLEDYEETKKELADWVNASPEELADVIAGM